MQSFRSPAAPSASIAYWACQLIGWGIYGLSLFYNVLLTLRIPLGHAVLEIAILIATAIALTHGLRDLMRRRLVGQVEYSGHSCLASLQPAQPSAWCRVRSCIS
jgi:hypothetical protein